MAKFAFIPGRRVVIAWVLFGHSEPPLKGLISWRLDELIVISIVIMCFPAVAKNESIDSLNSQLIREV